MDERQRRWNERYGAKPLVWSASANELLVREVQGLTPGSALDVGCGEGRNAIWLAEQGWDVTAIDFAATGIDKARAIAERKNVDVNWVVGDIETAQLASFSLVIVLYIHTSATERARWLPRMVESVAPGGNFIYIGHDPSNVEGGVGGPQSADVLPSVSDIESYLDEFKTIRATVVTRQVGQDPGHGGQAGIALDSLVNAERVSG